MIRNITYFFLLLLLPLVQLTTGCKDGGTGVEETVVPVITAVEPDSGRYGTTVFISGEHFGATPGENQVTFNGVEAMVTKADQTLLVAEVPKGAGSGPVQVTVNGETGPGPEFNYILTVTVSTWAGSTQGYADGVGANAQFYAPYGIEITLDGELIIADAGNNRIRKIAPDRTVTTLAGSGSSGTQDGIGTQAQFGGPIELAVNPLDEIFITEWQPSNIRHLGPSGSVTTFAGSGDYTTGDKDGTGNNAHFDHTYDIALNNRGELFVADAFNYKIRKVTMDREVSTFAGTGTEGYNNGNLNEAQFTNSLRALAVDSIGDIYVSDDSAIRRISDNMVSTFAGTPENRGYRDGPADEALFSGIILGMTLGPDGSLYVADSGNDQIRKISPDGWVTTIAGGEAGFKDGPGEEARFDQPAGLVFGDESTLYVSDTNNHRIRKITME